MTEDYLAIYHDLASECCGTPLRANPAPRRVLPTQAAWKVQHSPEADRSRVQ